MLTHLNEWHIQVGTEHIQVLSMFVKITSQFISTSLTVDILLMIHLMVNDYHLVGSK